MGWGLGTTVVRGQGRSFYEALHVNPRWCDYLALPFRSPYLSLLQRFATRSEWRVSGSGLMRRVQSLKPCHHLLSVPATAGNLKLHSPFGQQYNPIECGAPSTRTAPLGTQERLGQPRNLSHPSTARPFWPVKRLSLALFGLPYRAALSCAPLGITPVSRYRHSATKSLRARATIPTRLCRLPLPP